MDRKEEYSALLRELDQTPPELEYSVSRAKARARRGRARRWLGIPAGTLAGVFAAFVLLVNTVPTFALACSRLPVLGELAAAVDWSDSLSRAVEHEYVQPIGQSQTIDGLTVTVEYAIVDRRRVELFVTTQCGDEAYPYADLHASVEDKSAHTAVLTHGSYEEHGQLRQITIDFNAGQQVPEELTVRFYAQPRQSYGDGGESALEDMTQFTFALRFDPDKVITGRTYEVRQWLELDGQRVRVDRLEVYPTHARLMLRDDPDNDLRLVDLDFYLEDGEGTRYEAEGGIAGYSDPVTGFAFDHRVASPWYSEGEGLTLYVTAAAWLDEDHSQVTVDLTRGAAQGLPDGAALEEVRRNGDHTELVFLCADRGMARLAQLFSWTYTDPEGGVHHSTSGGSASDDEAGITREMVYLEDYPYDTVTLTLNRTRWGALEDPIAVEIN